MRPIILPEGKYPVEFIVYSALAIRLGVYTTEEITDAVANMKDIESLCKEMEIKIKVNYTRYKQGA